MRNDASWVNTNSGQVVHGGPMPAGNGWTVLDQEGEPQDTLGAVGLNCRGLVGFRRGGARPTPPAQVERDWKHGGFGHGAEVLRKGMR
jgi:hypothetical protein